MMNKDLGLIVWLLSVSVWAFAQTTGSPCTNNCVFPGDANNDHIVNKSDVLAIGLTYHYVGPVRQNPTSNWTAQSCPAWNGNIPGTNINSKYADCSGNGDVDFHDFDIVWQNYAQSQNYTPPQTTPTIPTTGVELRVLFDEDSLNIENHGGFQIYPFEAEIWVGNSNLAASDLYGLAFSIKYDSTLLGNAPLNVTYNTNWFGSPNSTKIVAVDNRSAGQLDIAVTRLNHQSANGTGRIAKIYGGVIGENIHGRNLRRYLKFNLTGIEAVNANGASQDMIGVSDSLLVSSPNFTATNNKTDAVKFQISPNPISASQNLNLTGLNTVFSYTINDMLGRIIRTEKNITSNIIATSDLQQGSYLLTITTEKGTTTKPFFIK